MQEQYMPDDLKKYIEEQQAKKVAAPQEQPLTIPEYLQLLAATGARVGLPIAGSVAGSLAGPLGTVGGGLLGGAAGEAIGQMIEPRSKGLRPASVAVAGAIGAIPGSALVKGGKVAESAVRGGLIGGASTAGYKWAEGESINPLKWSTGDLAGAALGAGLGGIFGKLTPGSSASASAPVKTPRTIEDLSKMSPEDVAKLPPPKRVTIEDVLSRRSKEGRNAVVSPDALEKSAMSGEVLGRTHKIDAALTKGLRTVDTTSLGSPDVRSLDDISNEITSKLDEAPHVLRVAGAREGMANEVTLAKLLRSQDVERRALLLEAQGKMDEAAVLRANAVEEGTAGPTTARAVKRANDAGIVQDARNANARDKFVQKSAEQEARNLNARDKHLDRIAKETDKEAAAIAAQREKDAVQEARNLNARDKYLTKEAASDRVDELTEGMVPEDPSVTVRHRRTTRDGGEQTVTQRYSRPEGEESTTGPTKGLVVAPGEARTIYSNRDDAMRDLHRTGAVDAVRSPVGRGWIHVFEKPDAPSSVPNTTSGVLKVAPMDDIDEVMKSTGVTAGTRPYTAGTTATPEGVVLSRASEAPWSRVEVGPTPKSSGKIHKTIIQAEGEAKKLGLDPRTNVAKVEGGYQVKASDRTAQNQAMINEQISEGVGFGGKFGDTSPTTSLNQGLKVAEPRQPSIDQTKFDPKTGKPRLGDEKGSISPETMFRIASGGIGAATGAAMNDEDPVAGAIVGGTAGAFAPSVFKGVAPKVNPNNLSNVGEGIKDTLTKYMDILPDYYRANLLWHPWNLPLNAIGGPWGSSVMAGLERKVAGDSAGDKILSTAFNPSAVKRLWDDAQDEAWSRIAQSESRAEGAVVDEGPEWLRDLLSRPGKAMTQGDVAARNGLLDAGLSEDMAREITMTSEPFTGLGKAISSWVKGGINPETGKRSVLARMMLPFYRTGINQFEQSMLRTPGLGYLYQTMVKGMDPNDATVLAQQGIGTGVMATSYFIGMVTPPEMRWQVRKVLDNLGGQYGALASTAYMAGQFAQNKEPGEAAVSAVQSMLEGDLPIPKTDPFNEMISGARFAVTGGEEGSPPLSLVPGGGFVRFLKQVEEM